jgi:hypothetical protein
LQQALTKKLSSNRNFHGAWAPSKHGTMDHTPYFLLRTCSVQHPQAALQGGWPPPILQLPPLQI